MKHAPHCTVASENGDIHVLTAHAKVVFRSSGHLDVYTRAPVRLHAPLHDAARSQPKAEPLVGERMEDGTIYAGISPATGQALYTTGADAPLTMEWQKAMRAYWLAPDYAGGLNAHGHDDWRLPSISELNMLFNNRATIGGFTDGWYWSSTNYNSPDRGFNTDFRWSQRFSDGALHQSHKENAQRVRCVRG